MRSKFFYTNLLFAASAAIITVAAPAHRGLFIGLLLFLYSLIVAAGCTFIDWNFFLISQNTLPSHTHKQIALTFDDGPIVHSSVILDILQRYNVKASFFLVGKNVAQNPEIAQRMHREGHTIGNHSMNHGHLINLKLTRGTVDEIKACNAVIEQHVGISPTLYRPPHGVVTHHLARALKQTDMRSVGWSIRSFDTASHDENALLKRLQDQLHDGAIVLLHDYCPMTAVVLPRFIEYAQSQGYAFVATYTSPPNHISKQQTQ
ncbi:MAG: polysaccharide deacetylase family protein [Formosimonas sp.]